MASVVVIEHIITIDPETRAFLTDLVRPVVRAFHRLETRMSAVDDALATIGTNVDELVKDVTRLIELFTAGGALTPEQQAVVDSLTAKLTAIDTSVEGAAPEAPAEPTA